MPKVISEVDYAGFHRDAFDGRWYLFCPGCYEANKVENPDRDEHSWTLGAIHCFSEKIHQFNGDAERPTLSPSLLVKGQSKVCHSFVNDGMIQYLGDCTHKLAGQTVPLMDVPPKKQPAG